MRAIKLDKILKKTDIVNFIYQVSKKKLRKKPDKSQGKVMEMTEAGVFVKNIKKF
jgi:hypothetical protein